MLLRRELTPPAPVTLTTVVYLPELDGFWSQGLDVLELCLGSLRATTPPPFELLVVDNGSCEEVREWLQERFAAGEIDQLLLSRRNLGKVGAWNLLFAAAQGEIVTYTDSDIYFLPGWFEATRHVLDAYPEAGPVTAQAMSRDLTQYCGATLEGARDAKGVEWREGPELVPRRFVEAHLRGLGESPESYEERIPTRRDVVLGRDGGEALAGSAHFQFTCRRQALAGFFPLPSRRAMGDVNVLDEAIDAAGLWRLSTLDYFVHHMGNCVPDLAEEVPWLDAESLSAPQTPSAASTAGEGRLQSIARRLWDRFGPSDRTRVRRLLKTVNRWSHELLYPD